MNPMRILSLSSLGKKEILEALRRPTHDLTEYRAKVLPIIAQVRQEGDKGIRALTKRFDGAVLDEIRVPRAACEKALQDMSNEWKSAVSLARENIERFHRKNMLPVADPIETQRGVRCWTIARPVQRVGIYIPGGSAPLFSTALMLGIPAKIAKVPEIVLCSPPQKNGEIADSVLAVSALLKIDVICRVGGAQAIAAMAYGTESIPKVDKIVGPGNSYVSAAKLEVSMDPEGSAIDMLAGPSELLIIADDTADPRIVAADLLAQAEHGSDSQVVLLTTDPGLLESVQAELTDQLKTLPRREIASVALEKSVGVLIENLAQAVELANVYAPEHLSIQTTSPEYLLESVQNAGSVFLGPFSAEVLGDYCSGPNHSLPTSGTARSTGGVTVETFRKRITVQKVSEDGLQSIGPNAMIMARAEALEAHARSIEVRIGSTTQS